MARTHDLDRDPRNLSGPDDRDLPGGGWGTSLAIALVVLFMLLAWLAMRDGAADEIAQVDPPRSAGQADPEARPNDGDGRVVRGDADGEGAGQKEGTGAPVDGEAGVEPSERGNT